MCSYVVHTKAITYWHCPSIMDATAKWSPYCTHTALVHELTGVPMHPPMALHFVQGTLRNHISDVTRKNWDSLLISAIFGLLVLSMPASVCLCGRASECVYQSRACPHDNSPRVQDRITKFGVKVQKILVKLPVFFGLIDLDLQGQI